MSHRRRALRQRGFTLMEVMIALAILAGGLVMAIGRTATHVRQVKRAKMLGVATDLARMQMYEIEEELLEEGFQEMSESVDGDFADQGWPTIKWEAEIEKVELPGLAAAQAASAAGEGDEEGGAGGLGGALGGMPGMGGAGGMDPTSMAGAGMVASQFEMIASVLEMSIRKVTLKVTWKVGHSEESITIVCYFTDPAGVDTAMSGGPAPGDAGDSGGDSGGDSSGSSSGSPRSRTRVGGQGGGKR